MLINVQYALICIKKNLDIVTMFKKISGVSKVSIFLCCIRLKSALTFFFQLGNKCIIKQLFITVLKRFHWPSNKFASP